VNFPALFKVKALHISHSLVDARNGGWVADSSLGAILGAEVRAMHAPNAHLTEHELLGALGMPSGNILFCGSKDLDKVRADVALAIGEGVSIRRSGQEHSALIGLGISAGTTVVRHFLLAIIVHAEVLESWRKSWMSSSF